MVYKFKYGDKDVFVPKITEALLYKYDLGPNINLNNLIQEGYYHQPANINTSTSLNYPTNEAGLLTVINRNYIYQTYHSYNNSGYWYRSQYNGTWYGWKKAVSADMLNWDNVTNKPTSFAPSYHSHAYDTWIGSQYASGGDWLGWYSAYGGSRRGYIQHTGSKFNIVSENGIISTNTSLEVNGSLYVGGNIQPYGRYNCVTSNELKFNSSDAGLYFNWNTDTSINYYKFCNSKQNGGAVHAASFNNYSDRKLKSNIESINKSKDFILSLKPVQYTLKYGESLQRRKHMGFIAQEVYETIKQLDINNLSIVSATVKEVYKDDEGNDKIRESYFDEKVSDDKLEWSLNYIEFIAPIVATIQLQQKEIDELKEQIKSLKDQSIQ